MPPGLLPPNGLTRQPLKDIVFIDDESRLRITPSTAAPIPPDSWKLQAILNSPKENSLCALDLQGAPFLIGLQDQSCKALPHADGKIAQLAQSADGTVWYLMEDGRVLMVGDGKLAPPDSSRWSAPAEQITRLFIGRGYSAALEKSGRCMLWGDSIPDSPQRFRLSPEKAELRVGSHGRTAAW